MFTCMGWTRRKLPPGNHNRDNHWIVAWDGVTVGSVHLGYHLPHHLTERWEWAAQTRPGGHGRVASLEEGLEAVRTTCLRDGKDTLLPPPPPWTPGKAR
jgi:hypothetical protein